MDHFGSGGASGDADGWFFIDSEFPEFVADSEYPHLIDPFLPTPYDGYTVCGEHGTCEEIGMLFNSVGKIGFEENAIGCKCIFNPAKAVQVYVFEAEPQRVAQHQGTGQYGGAYHGAGENR